MENIEFAVIGGSGLYNMPDLTQIDEVTLSTPFGSPSDRITTGTLHGKRVAFLPRHGRRHQWTPGEVPYQANIYALKLMGVRYILSVSACGSLREEIRPGDVVIPDQLVDYTKGKRESSFFGKGLVAHVGVANPFSPEMNRAVADAVRSAGGDVHESGTLITIEGPRFSTKGESELYRKWGMSIIGMTTSPEAFLAAEAEIAYSCMTYITDYDVWHETQEPVTVEMVVNTLAADSIAQSAISNLVATSDTWAKEFAAHSSLRDALALISDWNQVPAGVKEDLYPLIGKYL